MKNTDDTGTPSDSATSLRASLQPSVAFVSSNRNSGGINSGFGETNAQHVMMPQTNVSMLRIEVSAASRKAFFALHSRTIKSGIEVRAALYERTVASQDAPTFDESRPAQVILLFSFWWSARRVSESNHPRPYRRVFASNKPRSSSRDMISTRPLEFQNIGRDFPSAASFRRQFSCAIFTGTLFSLMIFCLTRTA